MDEYTAIKAKKSTREMIREMADADKRTIANFLDVVITAKYKEFRETQPAATAGLSQPEPHDDGRTPA